MEPTQPIQVLAMSASEVTSNAGSIGMPTATSMGPVRGSLTIPAAPSSTPGTYCFPGQSGVRNWSPGLASRPTRGPGATPSRPAAVPPSYAYSNGAAVQAAAPNGCIPRRGREPAIEGISVATGRLRSPVASPSPPAGSPAWVPPLLAEPLVGGPGVSTSTLRPIVPSRTVPVEGSPSRSDHSPPLPVHLPAPTAKCPATEQQDAAGAGARLTTTASSLGSSASVPTLTSERVPSRIPGALQSPQVVPTSRIGGTATPEVQVADLKRQLAQTQEALTSSQRLAEERGQEVGNLLARTEMLLARISERDAEVLRLRAQAAKYRDEMQGKDVVRPTADELSDPRQVAARRLQRAIRPWLAALRKNRDEASTLARDRWKKMLQEVEVAVSRALEHAVGTDDVGRVPRQTRLQLLGNTLKHGVLRVNQVMMQQTLQELRRAAVT